MILGGKVSEAITRRDHVAALIMQSIVATSSPEQRTLNAELMANRACDLADMLLARLDVDVEKAE